MFPPLKLSWKFPHVAWRALRHDDAFWPTLGLSIALTSSFGFAVTALLSGNLIVWVFGVLLLAQGLVWCAYLIHDLTHQALFRQQKHNDRLGFALCFLIGACYGRYQDLRRKHMRHHVQRADVVAVDYRRFLSRHPRIRQIVEVLEWAYIPAIDIIMHGLVMVAPFVMDEYRSLRRYTAGMLALRLSAFALICVWLPAVALGYVLAYVLMIHVLRFMDMHQHTYDVVYADELTSATRPSVDYERQNTYSNPLGDQRWLNFLVLNFGYHNAHHERPTAPWYQLPELHRQLYGKKNQVFEAKRVLTNYHRYRVSRVMSDSVLPDQQPGFTGLVGVSFLTTL